MGLVRVEDVEGGLRRLTLDRPERRNALSPALIEALLEALAEADADPSVRAVVLTGAGTAFCAGGDLAGGLQGDGGILAAEAARDRFVDLMKALPALGTPVVAAAQGDALGGGLGLLAACDLAVVDAGARLGTPEIRLGLFPWIILAVLQRHVGRKALLEMVLTGEKIDAERAVALGLANRVAPAGTAVAEAEALARTVASRSAAIVGLGKRTFHEVSELGYDAALRQLAGRLTVNLMTEDAGEGIAAFLQRRPPEWKDR